MGQQLWRDGDQGAQGGGPPEGGPDSSLAFGASQEEADGDTRPGLSLDLSDPAAGLRRRQSGQTTFVYTRPKMVAACARVCVCASTLFFSEMMRSLVNICVYFQGILLSLV